MTPSTLIPCVILCGGRSSRMGEDKALLPFSKSNTLCEYQYKRLSKYFKNVYISSKVDKFDFDFDKDKYLLLDTNEIFSPLVALQSILNKLEAKQVFIITVDTPLVSISSIQILINEVQNYDICVAKTHRTHNLCGLFSINILDFINEMISKDIHKVGYLLKNVNTKYVEFPSEDEFINLNDKDEYKKALNIISKINN